MVRYFSTFITGTQEIIQNALKANLNDVRIGLLLDGLVTYETSEPASKIRAQRYFNNTYVQLYQAKGIGALAAETLIKEVTKNPGAADGLLIGFTQQARSFRIVASEQNQIAPIESTLLRQAEGLFSNRLRLRVNRSKPDLEVWFLTRSEGYGFVGLRITKTPNYEKTLHKGELRPELAHVLCRVAEVVSTDVVLDPFAGYGSIPRECSTAFRPRQILAGESDPVVLRLLQAKLSATRNNIAAYRWNALHLAGLPDGSVDKIITDPPWGFHEFYAGDLHAFYLAMLKEFTRVVKSTGIIVLLIGRKDFVEEAINDLPELALLKKYDVLVSGRKSAIYKLQRR